MAQMMEWSHVGHLKAAWLKKCVCQSLMSKYKAKPNVQYKDIKNQSSVFLASCSSNEACTYSGNPKRQQGQIARLYTYLHDEHDAQSWYRN
jgi:hypothetical protein